VERFNTIPSLHTIFIDFRRCTLFNAFLPNAFSPNGDGINDGFRPYLPPDVEVTDYMFRVFDRWGNMVFETNQTNREWDGTFRGEILPQGVFLFLSTSNTGMILGRMRLN
jgi:gliding motility-associated-like protein